MTLIYGVKSTGNQAERGLRETERLPAEEYPQVFLFSIIICLQKHKKKTKNTYNKAPTTMFYVVGGKEKVKNII